MRSRYSGALCRDHDEERWLIHEGAYYKTLADIEKAGIKVSLVPGSHPWGSKAEGF